VLIEAHGWRLLVDPTFDPPGRRYRFGWGTSSVKLTGPAIPSEEIGPVDVVLLSHDHHADNLDDAGRDYLATAPQVLTTVAGSRRLGLNTAMGLRPWQVHDMHADGRPTMDVTATPCRHGPPLSRPISGAVIGFALRWRAGEGVIWVTGDTVLHRGTRAVARKLDIDVAVVHTGAVRFPQTGPLRYSMNGRDVVELTRLAKPRVVVPVHFDGWSHFSEQREELVASLLTHGRPAGLRFLTLGVALDV
jgi:L-ascorbate metabolism protein UlaG (beta-lactamase superfamily)